MQIYTKLIAGETVLFLIAEDEYERKMIEAVDNINKQLTCSIRRSPIFQETFLEIRKADE